MSASVTQALQQALQPRTGMQRIPFPTESYEHPSTPLSAKRLLNVFAEAQPQDARSPVALRTIPGLTLATHLNDGPVAAFNPDLVTGYYAVSGTQAFRNVDGAVTMIGDVGTAADPALDPRHVMVTIAVSPYNVAICVPPRLYSADHAGMLTEVDVTALPGGGINSICYIEGYFVATQHGRGNIFSISGLQDPTTWDPLDFATADALTTLILRCINHNGELWLLGYKTAEIWYLTGDSDFPFRRQSGGIVPYGFIPRSVAQIDKSVWWVCPDGCIYRSQGYRAERVSSHSIEAIVEESHPDFAIGMTYMLEGHATYVTTFEDLHRTVAYDGATQKWHDRTSDTVLPGREWRGLVAGRVGEHAYVGDAHGDLYYIDADGSLDAGQVMQQQITFPPLYAGTKRAFCSRVELEMQCPPDTDVLLSWSDDGGRTFNAPRVMSGAQAPNMRSRMVATRLGSFRQRVFRVQTASRCTFYAFDADVVVGAT